jgi:hypothetical protein
MTPVVWLIIGFGLGTMSLWAIFACHLYRRLQEAEHTIQRLVNALNATDQAWYRNTKRVSRVERSMTDILRTIVSFDKRIQDTEVVHVELTRSVAPPPYEDKENTPPYPWGPVAGPISRE